jgi:amidase
VDAQGRPRPGARRAGAAHLGAGGARPWSERRRLATWWESGFDLLVTPTQAAPPPPIGYIRSTADDPLLAFMRSAPYGACTLPFNMSGQPAISLPLHWTPEGLPIGVQVVGPFASEDLLLGVAAQLEAAAPWAERRPPLHA